MPFYMDLHNVPLEATVKDLAMAHLRDLEIQWKYDVKYSRYWFDPDQRKAFCLVEAPNVDAAVAVHREANGFVADKIIPVAAVSVEEMLGAFEEESPWEPDSGEDPPPAESAFRTILFTDMEGSTALTQRLGDEGAMRLLRTHDAIIREALSAHGGSEVKHTGDGIMASFSSVARAVECSIAAQRALAAYNGENPEATLRVRIGLSAGEPVTEHEDLFGSAVILASRVCAHADPECILVSNVVRDLCIGKQLPFVDRGEAALKGFQDPVRVSTKCLGGRCPCRRSPRPGNALHLAVAARRRLRASERHRQLRIEARAAGGGAGGDRAAVAATAGRWLAGAENAED